MKQIKTPLSCGVFICLIFLLLRCEYARYGGEELFEDVGDAAEHAFVCGFGFVLRVVFQFIHRYFIGA